MTNNNKVLGKNTIIPNSPNGFKFDLIKNLNKKFKFSVRFSVSEFTSICPVTMQPDFGVLIIDYVPKNWLVESKSLKTYIHSYRNHGVFHEEAVMKIGKDLFKSMKPVWFRIAGYFAPRGGIPIDVFWQSSKKPTNIEIPELKNLERKLFNR
tara:strand:+ start:121 stop:576 length:456 start_codon:yes stop_codon:yes gene_type:complete